MKIRRKSPMSGIVHEMDLPITQQQIEAYNRGALVQDAFPHLDPGQREFLLTGTTPEEWEAVFNHKHDCVCDACNSMHPKPRGGVPEPR